MRRLFAGESRKFHTGVLMEGSKPSTVNTGDDYIARVLQASRSGRGRMQKALGDSEITESFVTIFETPAQFRAVDRDCCWLYCHDVCVV